MKLDLMTVRSTGIAFFTLVLIASTWYYIWKVKQANKSSLVLNHEEEPLEKH